MVMNHMGEENPEESCTTRVSWRAKENRQGTISVAKQKEGEQPQDSKETDRRLTVEQRRRPGEDSPLAEVKTISRTKEQPAAVRRSYDPKEDMKTTKLPEKEGPHNEGTTNYINRNREHE